MLPSESSTSSSRKHTRRRRKARAVDQSAAVLLTISSSLLRASALPVTTSKLRGGLFEELAEEGEDPQGSTSVLTTRKANLNEAENHKTESWLLQGKNSEGAFVDDENDRLNDLRELWEAGRVTTPIDADSRLEDSNRHPLYKGNGGKTVHGKVQGKGKGLSTPGEIRRPSPFHSGDVGAHGSSSHLNLGLFRPGYPFVPSGRRQKGGQGITSVWSSYTSNPSDLGRQTLNGDDHLPHRSPGPPWSVPPSLSSKNVLRYGWTKSMLDDDARLSVPDEFRRPRSESASRLARELLRKKWWRWKPGEGYVWSVSKDFDIYKKGPGIALAQLLPPRDKPYTSSLPLIPNASKRELVYYIPAFIVVFALFAIFVELRAHFRTASKGKSSPEANRRRAANQSASFFVHVPANADESTVSYLLGSQSRSSRTRQRMKARNLRELCKGALDRGVDHLGLGKMRNGKAMSSPPIEIRPLEAKDGRLTPRWKATKENGDTNETTEMELLEKGGVVGHDSKGPLVSANGKYSARASALRGINNVDVGRTVPSPDSASTSLLSFTESLSKSDDVTGPLLYKGPNTQIANGHH